MALSPFDRARTEKLLGEFCEARVPLHVRDKVQLKFIIKGGAAILIESRPFFMDKSRWIDHNVAQFAFDAKTRVWALYCYDRNGKRRPYGNCKPGSNIEDLIAEVDADPTGIFWG